MSFPSLLILSPIHSSTPGPCRDAFGRLLLEYTKLGGEVDFMSAWLSTNLPEARTMLAEYAMGTKAELVLWLDDDIWPNIDDLEKLCASIDSGKQVVSGTYTHRGESYPQTVGELATENFRVDPDNPMCVTMKWIPLGFCLMKMEVLQKLFQKYDRDVFASHYVDGEFVSEDQSLSLRCHQMGIDIWQRLDVRVGHVGPHVFR